MKILYFVLFILITSVAYASPILDGEDFGDAPDSYQTLLGSDGARHTAFYPFSLGTFLDVELDGQPSPMADGDDLNPVGAIDDEDGVTLPPFLTPGAVEVVSIDGGLAGGWLDAWIDFDNNGMFDDPAEHLFGGGSILITPGPNPPIAFVVPPSTPAQDTYARFRLSSNGGLLPYGYAPDGEVEDYIVKVHDGVELLDYGDAPDSYQTLFASNGASHIAQQGMSLGPMLDVERDGQPTPNADGDDLNPPTGPDDEDGVFLPPALLVGAMEQFSVDGGALGGMLDAWIDFNGNGMFDHPAEHIFGGVSMPITPGVNPAIGFPVPASAIVGPTYARFRLSSNGGLLPFGPASEGEVEDYTVTIRTKDDIPEFSALGALAVLAGAFGITYMKRKK